MKHTTQDHGVITELKSPIPQGKSPVFKSKKKINIRTIQPFSYAEAIVEAIHEPILILDKYLKIQSANKAFFKTFKLSKKQTIGRHITDFTERNPQLSELIKRLKELSEHNTSFTEFELTYTFRKIGARTLLINAERILFDKQTTDLILLGIEDITQRKQVEQQKDDFVGYVTHELKTPITTITAFMQILEGYHNKTGDKKSQFLIKKVSEQVKRLSTLLTSFATVYKARSGKMPLRKKSFALDKLVHEVIGAFQYTTSSHQLIITGELSRPVFADREKIHEVVANLISNAIKYSPQGKKIIISFAEKNDEAIVSVQDFGIGISHDEQKKVFERFFRVHGKREKKIEGLGLGLFLVSEIIQMHGGKLWVESKPGKGSTFSFSLPIKK